MPIRAGNDPTVGGRRSDGIPDDTLFPLHTRTLLLATTPFGTDLTPSLRGLAVGGRLRFWAIVHVNGTRRSLIRDRVGDILFAVSCCIHPMTHGDLPLPLVKADVYSVRGVCLCARYLFLCFAPFTCRHLL